MRRQVYTVEYKMLDADKVKQISVIASNKADAWDVATYELIPEKEGEMPYSSWVYSVTYQNGNYKRFNNFEGNPY